jgi:hypothetical protein
MLCEGAGRLDSVLKLDRFPTIKRLFEPTDQVREILKGDKQMVKNDASTKNMPGDEERDSFLQRVPGRGYPW